MPPLPTSPWIPLAFPLLIAHMQSHWRRWQATSGRVELPHWRAGWMAASAPLRWPLHSDSPTSSCASAPFWKWHKRWSFRCMGQLTNGRVWGEHGQDEWKIEDENSEAWPFVGGYLQHLPNYQQLEISRQSPNADVSMVKTPRWSVEGVQWTT